MLSSDQTNELFLSLVHSYRFRPSFLSFSLRSHHHLHIVSSLTSVSIDLARSSSAPHHTTFFSLHTFAYSHSTTFHHTHSAPPPSALKRYHLPTQAFLPKSTFAVNKITKQKFCGFTFLQLQMLFLHTCAETNPTNGKTPETVQLSLHFPPSCCCCCYRL